MCLNLILSENRLSIFQVWSEVFAQAEQIIVINTTVQMMVQTQQLDAEFMRGIFAHERYGKGAKVGECEILNTKGEIGMPPWVITIPAFTGHLKRMQQANGSYRMKIVQNEELHPEEEVYRIFSNVFKSIEKFNQRATTEKIQSLGANIEFLDFPVGDPHKEARAVYKAYLDYYGKV